MPLVAGAGWRYGLGLGWLMGVCGKGVETKLTCVEDIVQGAVRVSGDPLRCLFDHSPREYTLGPSSRGVEVFEAGNFHVLFRSTVQSPRYS